MNALWALQSIDLVEVTFGGGSGRACSATAGLFKLTHGGVNSADILFNANEAAVQTAFRGMSNVDAASTVSFGMGKTAACDAAGTNTMTLTFGGTAKTEAVLTATVPATDPSLVHAVTTAGAPAGASAVQTVVCTATAGSFKLTHGGVDSAIILFNANEAAVQTAFQGMSTVDSASTVAFGVGKTAACDAGGTN